MIGQKLANRCETHSSWTFSKIFLSSTFTRPVIQVQPLQGQLGGSGRSIIRLAGENISAIGILHGVREENAAFLEFSRHFRRHGLPVPEIYAEDLSQGAYLEEDLGDTTLFEFLSDNRDGSDIPAPVVEAYRKVVEVLPRFQVEAGRDLNYKKCYPRGSFDRQSITWDLNYFKYYFLRLAGVPFNEQALEDDFSRLTKFLFSAGREYFLYRDFQSRNIMLRGGRPFLWTIKVVGKAPCNTISLPFCTTPRLLCHRSYASNCLITTSTVLPDISNWTAKPSCSTTTLTSTSASCRRWARTAFVAFTNARLISCKACRMR